MKSLYVSLIRRLRAVLELLGLWRLLESWAGASRTGTWVRSLFAVYDVEDLASLDLPWWNLEAAERVDEFLRKRPDARVLEWGSGASTLWLARRAAEVVSVEHDEEWADRLRPLLPASVRLVLVPPTPAAHPTVGSRKRGHGGLDFSAYVGAADALGGGSFDLIVVDGRAREHCFDRALGLLRPGGVVVFDNVERRRYREAIASAPVTVEWTHGLTACLPYPARTALVRVRG